MLFSSLFADDLPVSYQVHAPPSCLPQGVSILGLSLDSRSIEQSFLFAAIQGASHDGSDFIVQALQKGAVVIVGVKNQNLQNMVCAQGGIYIETLCVAKLYAHLCARFYTPMPSYIVALTGTNGKTSIVNFLRQIWDYAGYKGACFGTLGIDKAGVLTPLQYTTPDARHIHMILQDLAQDGYEYVAMEASSHGLAQYRLEGVTLCAAGFSNLSHDHLDYHQDMDAYFQAKARLFTELAPANCPAIINVDTDYGKKMAQEVRTRGGRLISCGVQGKDIRIDSVQTHVHGQKLRLFFDGEDTPIELDFPLIGDFQISNAVLALGLAIATGVDKKLACTALAHLHGVEGRLQCVGKAQNNAPIFVDFAHTPEGLEIVLKALRPYVNGRLIIVFGCGGDRDKVKRPLMGAVAQQHADYIIVSDDNPRTEDSASIRAQIMTACPDADNIGDRSRAIATGIDMLQEGDVLLIAGKGHENTQTIGMQSFLFHDGECVRKHLEQKQGGAYV